MTAETARAFAIAAAALWVTSALLALAHRRLAAALLNIAVAAPVAVLALVDLVRIAVDREAYIRQYGRAALHELPMTAVLLALGLVAICGSVIGRTGPPWRFVVAWLANAPSVALVVFLAFLFHIF